MFVQYTNPGGYPPIEHAVALLTRAGWTVDLLGTGADGSGALVLPPHPRVRLLQRPRVAPGWAQKADYVRFTLHAGAHARAWRPHVIYASDPLAAPAALLASAASGRPVVYHEHDAPPSHARGAAGRAVLAARGRLLRVAAVCVAPGAARRERLLADGRPPTATTVVAWNTPLRAEVVPRPLRPGGGPLRLHYHGSLVPQRVPLTVVDAVVALGGQVALRVVGYETAGSPGWGAELRRRAERQGAATLVEVLPPLPRAELLALARQADVGLSVVVDGGADENLGSLVGPSNKPFDYLACGLPLVVPAGPAWQEVFVRPGLARSCDPTDSGSIVLALRWFLDHPEERLAMARGGQERLLDGWCYEEQFAPVLQAMEALAGAGAS